MQRLIRICAALGLALLLGLAWAPAALAQTGVDWRERSTTNFTILYAPGAEPEAERYVGFVDTIYEEIATTLSFRTATPLTLRLYPTAEDYYQVTPAARNVPGVVAHADFRRRELVIIVERTRQQTEEEVRNNVRHELTHIAAADLSGGRLNTGLQEGVAQYMEKPAPELERKIAALRVAFDQGRLLPWSAFDERDDVYGAPDVAYPQSLSVVAFLVERSGVAGLRDFLTISARSSGYRSALERSYGSTPAELEAAWRTWLPSYLGGGYRTSAIERYDLSRARGMLDLGSYAAAVAELEQASAWLEKNAATQPAELRTEAAGLLERARAGAAADSTLGEARAALERADYPATVELVDAARGAYAALGDVRQEGVLAIYAERAARGMAADAQLSEAADLARTLRIPQARAAADAAADEFSALGDSIRMGNALALRRDLDQRQRLLGLILVAGGGAGLLLGLIGRIFFARPAEVW